MLVIIPCGGAKVERGPVPARLLYTGGYFKQCLRYALALTEDPSKVLILSAKYGLLGLNDPVEPYNLTLGEWGAVDGVTLRRQARRRGVLGEARVIALGGVRYTSLCKAVWPHCRTPLDGVGVIGKQMAWLKTQARRLSCSDSK